MINILCANPCIDKIYYLDDFVEGKMYRSKEITINPGGKGINIAKILKSIDIDSNLFGFYGGYLGQLLLSLLKSFNIKNNLISSFGETRTNINIINKSNNKETELLEDTLIVNENSVITFFDIIENSITPNSTFIISGSLPTGLDTKFYSDLISFLNKKKVKVILDTSETALLDTLKEKPYIIKPNLRELAFISKKELHNLDDIRVALDYIVNKYDTRVVLSMGKDGGIYKSKTETLRIEHPKIKVLNTIGSGDSLTCGLGIGLDSNFSLYETLSLGFAMAVSNTQFLEIGMIDYDFVKEFMKKITIKELL